MFLWIAFFSTLAGLVTVIYAWKSMRPVDRHSTRLAAIQNSGIPTLLSFLGLRNKLRPPLVERVARNGRKVLTGPLFAAHLDVTFAFKIRDDDVFVVTYPKSGTTWMQEISWMICHNADIQAAYEEPVSRRVPFFDGVDFNSISMAGIQTLEKWPFGKQRIIKTHFPPDFLPIEVLKKKMGKIIYVARNPKDVCVSFYHFQSMNYTGPNPGTWNEYVADFCSGKGIWGSWFDHVLEYWEEYKKDKNQFYFTTYEALIKDLRSEVVSIAKFLGKQLTDEQIDAIADHCTFDSMSKNKQTNYEHLNNSAFNLKKSKFMRKGKVGDWKNHFTINQNAIFDEIFESKMNGSGLQMTFEL